MQDLEAFIFHVLRTVSFDIGFHKFEGGLERDHWVLQVILLNRFLSILEEVRDSLDARLALKILALNQFLKVLLQLLGVIFLVEAKLLQDSKEDALKALEVPILVDAGADNA